MNVLAPQIDQTKALRDRMINYLASFLPNTPLPPPPGIPANVLADPGTWQGTGREALNFLVPQPEDTLIAPAELALNYRTPAQIMKLRRTMAEEQRARGAMADIQPGGWINREGKLYFEGNTGKQIEEARAMDQILRGSWYHGMSEKARSPFIAPYSMEDITGAYPGISRLDEAALPMAFNQGFPLSRHDAASISNKLGEPAGVSLSLNPMVSGTRFTPDGSIFRVMPLYGGPPNERVVNLMTKEGRNALNDAYDVVANDIFSNSIPEDIRTIRMNAGIYDDPLTKALNGNYPIYSNKYKTGYFNQSLSDQLQSQGYRGILYNPQRWGEHEMLMLDPKYALPLDYRPYTAYMNNRLDSYFPGTELMPMTPKAQQGLNSIQDVMAQNHSRLGDIYAERSWWNRLSEPVKNILLQDNPQAELIMQKLKGGQ